MTDPTTDDSIHGDRYAQGVAPQVSEDVLEAEYQAIAAEQNDEDRAVRAAMRHRVRLRQ